MFCWKLPMKSTFFPGLLYGGDPDNDTRPAFLQRLATGIVKDQVRWNYVKSNDYVKFEQNLANVQSLRWCLGGCCEYVAWLRKALWRPYSTLQGVLWQPNWYSAYFPKAKLSKFGAVKTTLGSGPEQLRKSMEITKQYLQELEVDLG